MGASEKPFRAHIGRKSLSTLFFVDSTPSLGPIVWWFRRVAFLAQRSDECVTASGAHPTENEKEATPMKTSYTLTKSWEGFWVMVLRHEDGTHNDYRFRTKREALRWLKEAEAAVRRLTI